MMKGKEIKDYWKEIVKIYKETIKQDNPKITMDTIYQRLDKAKVNETFATIAAIKSKDGRISQQNRQKLKSIPVDPDNLVWSSSNPVIYAGVDDIHTSHIDNLITELEA